MTEIYILTREGRAYTEEGIRYLTESMSRDYNITGKLRFIQGGDYNNPEYLVQLLDKAENTPVIVLSTKDSIITLTGEHDIKTVKKVLLENPDRTSWESLIAAVTNQEEK